MKKIKYLQATIIGIVNNQIKAREPFIVTDTYSRLCKDGYSVSDSKKLIGCALSYEIMESLKERKDFNVERYSFCLNKLPHMPWE